MYHIFFSFWYLLIQTVWYFGVAVSQILQKWCKLLTLVPSIIWLCNPLVNYEAYTIETRSGILTIEGIATVRKITIGIYI